VDKMNEIKMAVSNNLKKYRLAKNLTQKQLADEIKFQSLFFWKFHCNRTDDLILTMDSVDNPEMINSITFQG